MTTFALISEKNSFRSFFSENKKKVLEIFRHDILATTNREKICQPQEM